MVIQTVIYLDNEWYRLRVEKNVEEITIGSPIIKKGLQITIQISDLLRTYGSRGFYQIPEIIDLEGLVKQNNQIEYSTLSNMKWDLLGTLRNQNLIKDDFKISKETVKELLKAIYKLYLGLADRDQEEMDRYNIIEKKINRIIYERQIRGIAISKSIISGRAKELEEREYNLKNQLQLDYGLFQPTSKTYLDKHFEQRGYIYHKSHLYTLKTNIVDKLDELLYDLNRTNYELSAFSLLSLSNWGAGKRTYPSYHGFGTITSRITLRNPAIQNIRKSNRDIFIADPGKRLYYIDYSQFEAGILASLSQDKALLKLYNKNDIYSDLAIKVFGDRTLREKAKIEFYKYIYGFRSKDKSIASYFEKFVSLAKYKNEIESELETNGRIGSTLGNYRYKSGTLDNNTWALSHKIQSIASLILKESLISVYESVEDVEFLIPMHDAALYQIDQDFFEQRVEEIKEIFTKCFSNKCPGIKAKVKGGDFFEDPLF